jgi:hypothetical protein
MIEVQSDSVVLKCHDWLPPRRALRQPIVDDDAIPKLETLLDDEDEDCRYSVAHALAEPTG